MSYSISARKGRVRCHYYLHFCGGEEQNSAELSHLSQISRAPGWHLTLPGLLTLSFTLLFLQNGGLRDKHEQL